MLAGATATGKTDLAIRLAERLALRGEAAEIISADSRQVYRGLDIGTAKATPEDRARVPHYGLDLAEPDEPFTVADFVHHADAVLDDLARRDRIGILTGGTGLYLRAVATGLDVDGLGHDPEIRATIEADLVREGLPTMVERLRALDPARAERLDARNPRRVVRALEIATIHGVVPPPPPRGYPGPVAWIGLRLAPEVHRSRIVARARSQFDAGLIEEAAALRDRFDPGLPAFTAIGYREAWAVLDGEVSQEAAVELDAGRTVAFARRQATWFRREPTISWLDADGPDLTEHGLAVIAGLLAAAPRG